MYGDSLENVLSVVVWVGTLQLQFPYNILIEGLRRT